MPDVTNPASVAVPNNDDLDNELEEAAQATKQALHQNPQEASQLGDSLTIQDEVVDIERDLMNEILTRLEQNQMSPEKAQQLAKTFLSYLPMHDQKDLLDKLNQLSQANRELTGIYLKYAKPSQEYDRHKKLKLMSEHIQNGKIEEALAVAKGESHA